MPYELAPPAPTPAPRRPSGRAQAGLLFAGWCAPAVLMAGAAQGNQGRSTVLLAGALGVGLNLAAAIAGGAVLAGARGRLGRIALAVLGIAGALAGMGIGALLVVFSFWTL